MLEKKKEEKTKILLAKYRSLLKIQFQKVKVERGSIVMIRSRDNLTIGDSELIKTEMQSVVGHDEFQIIFSPSYAGISVILKETLELIIGTDIINAWKETKNLTGVERVDAFQKWIEDNGKCEGC